MCSLSGLEIVFGGICISIIKLIIHENYIILTLVYKTASWLNILWPSKCTSAMPIACESWRSIVESKITFFYDKSGQAIASFASTLITRGTCM